mgnify:CR=1 FL=1
MKLLFTKKITGIVEMQGDTLEECINNYYEEDTVTLLDNAEWFESLTLEVQEAEAE